MSGRERMAFIAAVEDDVDAVKKMSAEIDVKRSEARQDKDKIFMVRSFLVFFV